MSFKEKGYQIIRNAISLELAEFCHKYFLLKAKVFKKMLEEKTVSPYITFMGTFNDPQVPNSYAHYADIVMETLLIDMQKKMQEETNLNLVPTYSYARIYYKGNALARHKDRPSCEISTTMNLGGDMWPIYVDPTGEDNVTYVTKSNTEVKKQAHPGIKVDLNPGDMLIYKGYDLEHWRETFDGDVCTQVFLHYNDTDSNWSEKNQFDGREFIGLPDTFKRKSE
tara:strand:- start:5511 stop:6182 length:672 start_codon:yes stop_codon:yes gene_type:complete